MFLVVASILVIGGFIWFQAHRIGKLQEQNAILLIVAARAMERGDMLQERVDILLDCECVDREEDARKAQAYAKLLSL